MSTVVPYAWEDAGAPTSLVADYRSTVSRAAGAHPGDPDGADGCWDRLMGPAMADLTTQHRASPLGQRIIITGRVLDERGRPVPDTVMEIWQANTAGRYVHVKDQWDAPLDPNFTGSGRVVTDGEGRYRFVTVRPAFTRGAITAMRGGRHISICRCSALPLRRREVVPVDPHFVGFGRASTDNDGVWRFRTIRPGRVPGPDGEGNDTDPVLAAVPVARRGTLIAEAHDGGWWLDIVLQGPGETVFFDL